MDRSYSNIKLQLISDDLCSVSGFEQLASSTEYMDMSAGDRIPLSTSVVQTGKECDWFCRAETACVAASFSGGMCHLYSIDSLVISQETGALLFLKDSAGLYYTISIQSVVHIRSK